MYGPENDQHQRTTNKCAVGRSGLAFGKRVVPAGSIEASLLGRMGTAWVVVDRWERGRAVPTLESIVRIAKALHVNFDQLLGESAADPAAKSDALRLFRSHLAPPDMTTSELLWLEAVPDQAACITPSDYAELLQWSRSRSRQSEKTKQAS